MSPVFVYILIGIFALYLILMIPLQYHYLVSLYEKELRAGSQAKLYDEMSFEELNIHANTQSIHIIPNFIAYIIFKFKYKNKHLMP
ncbi:DUF3949 domain-containing protein [Clostridium sp. YIM B02551]|uniref:DUF3949 domain-containing protein n=1 Tax=Clostridium sp. YIM B02551 TaxID=2910679 RepID=UPI001EE9B9A7|nr:DUF3949 domain-containing protein [Clostridium sp. YIM B02551]